MTKFPWKQANIRIFVRQTKQISGNQKLLFVSALVHVLWYYHILYMCYTCTMISTILYMYYTCTMISTILYMCYTCIIHVLWYLLCYTCVIHVLWYLLYYTCVIHVLWYLLHFNLVARLRYETEAASNTDSALLQNTYIINHKFIVYKCVCTNIKVGMAVKLWNENLDSNKHTVKMNLLF